MSGLCLDCGLHPVKSGGLCNGCYGRHQDNGSLDAYARVASLPSMAALDVSWHIDAACAEVDPDLWFPEKGGSVQEAKEICATCLVRAECLEYALETRQRFGIWGMRSERERRRLLGLDEDDDTDEEGEAA